MSAEPTGELILTGKAAKKSAEAAYRVAKRCTDYITTPHYRRNELRYVIRQQFGVSYNQIEFWNRIAELLHADFGPYLTDKYLGRKR